MGPARLHALAALALLAVAPTDAQVTAKDPALPAEAAYVMIDDQLFDVGDRVPNGGGRILPQGATLDSQNVTWFAKYNGWEAGVVPIEFDASVTAARRAMFMLHPRAPASRPRHLRHDRNGQRAARGDRQLQQDHLALRSPG